MLPSSSNVGAAFFLPFFGAGVASTSSSFTAVASKSSSSATTVFFALDRFFAGLIASSSSSLLTAAFLARFFGAGVVVAASLAAASAMDRAMRAAEALFSGERVAVSSVSIEGGLPMPEREDVDAEGEDILFEKRKRVDGAGRRKWRATVSVKLRRKRKSATTECSGVLVVAEQGKMEERRRR